MFQRYRSASNFRMICSLAGRSLWRRSMYFQRASPLLSMTKTDGVASPSLSVSYTPYLSIIPGFWVEEDGKSQIQVVDGPLRAR